MSSQRDARAAPGPRGGGQECGGRRRPRNGRTGPRAAPAAPVQADVATLPEEVAMPEGDGLVLVIGAISEWTDGKADRPGGGQIVFAEYDEVTADLIRRLSPAVVISSVIAATFDAFDLAQHLRAVGYGGPYRALTPRLPDPDLVRREVASCAPGLDFELLVIDRPAEG